MWTIIEVNSRYFTHQRTQEIVSKRSMVQYPAVYAIQIEECSGKEYWKDRAEKLFMLEHFGDQYHTHMQKVGSALHKW